MTLTKHIARRGAFIIAEAGSNHDGDITTARELIRAAKRSGADAVKFQAFTKDGLFAQKEYERTLKLKAGALDGVDGIAFRQSWYADLSREAKRCGIEFMVTPFSVAAVDELRKIKVECYKVASCDIQFIPLLRAIAVTKRPVILSTGLADERDIRAALDILKNNEVALLHCVVEYPAPVERMGLAYIRTLADRYHVIPGFSDHSRDTVTPALAVAYGARVIEKHFTVTPEKKGGDHAMSLSPGRFAEMVSMIRTAEKAAGSGEKMLTAKEKKELVFARRGIFAAKDICKGDTIIEGALNALRPCTGIPAGEWDGVVGKKAVRDIRAGSPVRKGDIR